MAWYTPTRAGLWRNVGVAVFGALACFAVVVCGWIRPWNNTWSSNAALNELRMGGYWLILMAISAVLVKPFFLLAARNKKRAITTTTTAFGQKLVMLGWAVVGVLWLYTLMMVLGFLRVQPHTIIGVVLMVIGGAVGVGGLLQLRRGKRPAMPENEEATIHRGIHGDAHYAITREVEHTGLFTSQGIPFGTYHSQRLNRVLPLHYLGEQHLITISPNRTGKGTTAIMPTLLEHDASCIVIDPKGQAAAVTARRRREMGHDVYFLNPFGLHGLPSHSFNPLETLSVESPYYVAQVSALAEALIIHSGGDTFWTDSAHDLLEALLMWVCFFEREEALPDYATLPKVRELLCAPLPKFHELMELISLHTFPPMRQKVGQFVGDDGTENRTVRNIISTTIAQTRILDDPAIARSLGASDFQWADLKRKPMTVYLILPADYLESHAKWLRLVLTSALAALQTAEKPPKPVLFILDEFAQLGHLAAIANAMGLAAGYGIQLWPILQDLNQLKDRYKDRWETFLANAGITQLLRANDLTTAEYFSRRMGTYTGKSENLQAGEISHEQARMGFTGTSTGRGDAAVPVAMPQELMGLADQEGILCVSGMPYPVKMHRQPYYTNPRYQGLYDPDPFYAGTTV